MKFDHDRASPAFARRLFQLRFNKLRISQEAFAERFGLSFGAVKDLEQGRTQPTRTMLLLAAAIERDPAFMANIADQERPTLMARQPKGHRWSTNNGPPAIAGVLQEAAR